MFLHQIDLTTALRPSLLPDETLLFVQDAVGLYEGKYKIPQYQNGHAYLTSHRACYVDNDNARQNSVAVHLKDVERAEFYAGFLKSSPKVTLFPKPVQRQTSSSRGHLEVTGRPTYSVTQPSTPPRHGSPFKGTVSLPPPSPAANATWICPICSYPNKVPSNFDPSTANALTPLPACEACGIKPPLIHIVKASISAIANRQNTPTATTSQPGQPDSNTPLQSAPSHGETDSSVQCPRCTFANHPSLISCEICGASLVSNADRRLELHSPTNYRAESPSPSVGGLTLQDSPAECIKFSFRGGGEKIFYERLKNALIQRKWLLQSAPPIPRPQPSVGDSKEEATSFGGDANPELSHIKRTVGIAGLERRGLEQRKNNEVVIGSAFEDLEALMTSAKEVIAIAESLAQQVNLPGSNGASAEAKNLLSQSASALGLVTTRDMLGSGSSSLYISELSRNLAEFLTEDTNGILRKEGGIMTLVDLWAIFNRVRGGVELVSPSDFEKAARMWDTLKLPVRLRRFKSGLLVVQGRDRTDDKTIASLMAWLKDLHATPPDADVAWDWRLYGRGVTAQETAERFGWSVGVASEELEMAEEKGVLCREHGLEGLRFWENWLVNAPPPVSNGG